MERYTYYSLNNILYATLHRPANVDTVETEKNLD